MKNPTLEEFLTEARKFHTTHQNVIDKANFINQLEQDKAIFHLKTMVGRMAIAINKEYGIPYMEAVALITQKN
jgi:pantoate kinase